MAAVDFGAVEDFGLAPSASSSVDFGAAEDFGLVETPKTNWAGTGPAMSTKEYFKSGFAGRFIVNATRDDQELRTEADRIAKEQAGASWNKSLEANKKYKDIYGKEFTRLAAERDAAVKAERQANPEPSIGESLKEFGKQVLNDPWGAAKGMIYELGKDPELLLAGPGVVLPKAGAAATTVGKVAKVATDIGKSAVKAGALGIGAETVAQTGQVGGYDTQRIINTGASFAAGGALINTALKVAKPFLPEIKFKPKQAAEESKIFEDAKDFEESVKEPVQRDLFEGDSEDFGPTAESVNETRSAFDAQENLDFGTTKGAADFLKDPLVESRTFIGDALSKYRAIERTINNAAEKIRQAVPELGIRERITLALEKDREYDKIYTDIEKAEMLDGTSEVDPVTNRRTNIGMQGALDIYDSAAQSLGLSTTKTFNPKNAMTPKGFDTFWTNYIRRNKLEGRPLQEQITHFEIKKNKLEYSINRLRNLPSEEHALPVLENLQKAFTDIGQQAVDAGVFDFLRNNYVTHILNYKNMTVSRSQLDTILNKIYGAPKDSRFVRNFAESRIFETIRDLDEALQGTGVVVERDIAKVYEIYAKSMQNAIIQKGIVDKLLETSIDGKPALTKDLELGVNSKYVKFDSKDSKIVNDYLVHPDIANMLGYVFRQTEPSQALRALSGVSYLTKALQTSASLFHATSLGFARLSAAPFSTLKDFLSGGRGTREAVKLYREGGLGDVIDVGLRNGLVLGTEDVSQSIIADAGVMVDKILSKVGPEITAAQKITSPFDKFVIQKMNKFTWEYMHTGGKIHLFTHVFTSMRAKNPTIPDEVLAKEAASFVNNTLGGLDWFRVANSVADKIDNIWLKDKVVKAGTIAGREWAQVLMFAPDWTVSTLRAVTTALPKELSKPKNWELKEGVKGIWNPKTQGDLARRYVLNTAIIYLTYMNGVNLALVGKYIWENEDPTRVDLGDGTTMQLAKHNMEAAHWALDFGKTLKNKLGFVPKTIGTLLDDRLPASEKAKQIGSSVLPFQVSAAVRAPTGERLKRSFWSFIGMPIYGSQREEFLDREVAVEKAKERAIKKFETAKKKAAER
jgi:hypothetical protein